MEPDKKRSIKTKSILSTVKSDEWFGLHYNMNLYRGCQHGCIYCDSRSNCYRVENFSNPAPKTNALKLFALELSRKKVKGTIGFGSMNDPYMPIETDYQLTSNALKIIEKYRFPVHIITKSNLILNDLQTLRAISKTYVAVSFTITTASNDLAKIIEPNAPLPSERFEAIKTLSDNGIYTGITLMPILPFINDNVENVQDIITTAHEVGAKYIIPFFGVTLRDGSREYFYNQLDKHFEGMRKKYENHFGNRYICNSPNAEQLYDLFYNLCRKYKIETRMKFYQQTEAKQMKLF
jgi:DNA repair photolyase